jgi:hypothetical protein
VKDRELEAYLDRVEREFFRRKGRPGLLSPADFALASAWFRERVPLDAVLEGMAAAFDAREGGRDAGTEEVNSLAFCESYVAAALARRRGPA